MWFFLNVKTKFNIFKFMINVVKVHTFLVPIYQTNQNQDTESKNKIKHKTI